MKQGENMPVKAPVKKTIKRTQKPVKKSVKKSIKKVTWDDIQEGFRELQQSNKELWKLHKETEKKLNKVLENLNHTLGETEETLNQSIEGHTLESFLEHIKTPGLSKKFKQFGFSFDLIKIIKYAEGVYAEIDALLENSTQALVIRIETPFLHDDIDNQLNRMEKVRKHADEHGDKRQFIGAIAAINIDESARNYALKKGLFVIEPSGEDVKVTKPVNEVRIW